MYFVNGEFAGDTYNGVDVGGDDFGLDVYEPEFFYDSALWGEAKYVAKLTLTDEEYDGDLFYFCHIHNKMSARIKQVDDDGKILNKEDTPELGYEYEVPSDFDKGCGTYGTGDFQESSGKCKGPFICTEGDETESSDAPVKATVVLGVIATVVLGLRNSFFSAPFSVLWRAVAKRAKRTASSAVMASALLDKNTLPEGLLPYKTKLTPRFYEVREKVIDYVNEVVIPGSHAWGAQRAELMKTVSHHTLCPQPPILKQFLAEAKARGIINLFLPEVAKMSVLEYSPIAEILGMYHMANLGMNCSAPDTGNMEVLEKFGSEAHRPSGCRH